MQDVFLQQRESNLLSNAGHTAEITEQVFMWCFLPQREVNLPSNAGHAAEITEQVSPHHLLPTSYLCALQERIIMNKLKIYSATQPNNKRLVHSTFPPPTPAASS